MRHNWDKDKIKKGFDRFKAEFERLPRAHEIDELNNLPSSRFIQMKFGGLSKLRKELGYEDNHFGKGVFRSKSAKFIISRGRRAELALEKILKNKFGEVFVHTEKIFDNSMNRVDFYVYSPDGDFGVDVFCTNSLKLLRSIINIKQNKYHNFPKPLFFVVANDNFNQSVLDESLKYKVKLLDSNIKIITMQTLLNFIKQKNSYPNPLNSMAARI